METISCIICGSNSHAFFDKVQDRFSANSNLFQLVRCQCGFVYLNPRPTHDNIKNYYNLEEYDPHEPTNRGLWKKVYTTIQLVTFYWKFIKIRPFKLSGKILDIGGGQGEFTNYMANKDWFAYLQDEHSTQKDFNNSNKVKYFRFLNDIPNDKYFQVISLWHSLEHIHDIEYVMKYINKNLEKDGIALIAVPNLDAPERLFLKRNWIPYDPPRHLYHFNLTSLEALCDKFKLKVIRKHSMYQDTPYNVLISLKPLNTIKFIAALSITIFSWAVTFIRGPKYSSSILLVCQRQ